MKKPISIAFLLMLVFVVSCREIRSQKGRFDSACIDLLPRTNAMFVAFMHCGGIEDAKRCMGMELWGGLTWYESNEQNSDIATNISAVVIVKFPDCVARNINQVGPKWDARGVADSFFVGSRLRTYAGSISDDKKYLCLVGARSDMQLFVEKIYDFTHRLQPSWGR